MKHGKLSTPIVTQASAGAAVMAEVASSMGLSLDGLLAGTSLRSFDLDDPRRRVSHADECQLISNLLAHGGEAAGLGLEVGRRLRFMRLGSVGMALVSSQSLRGALKLGARFADLACSAFHFGLESSGTEGHDLRVVFDEHRYPAALRRFVVERGLGLVLTMGTTLLQRPMRPLAVELSMPNPGPCGAWLARMDARLTVGQPRSALVLCAEDLDDPLPHGDVHTLHLIENQCTVLQHSLRLRLGLAEQVRALLVQEPERLRDMKGVAASLCLTERTLRRRLLDEGTSFQKLCDEVRRTLAHQLLAIPGFCLGRIADQLGYAEPASFVHAFKRWEGVTPSAFRARAAALPVRAHKHPSGPI